MTGLLTDPIGANDRLDALGLDALAAPTSQVWGAEAEETWARNPATSPWHMFRRAEAEAEAQPGARTRGGFIRNLDYDPDSLLSAEDANARYGIPGELSFDGPTAIGVAEQLHELKREELQRRDVFGRARGGFVETAGRLAIGFGVSALDPINVASAFIPVVGEARYALWASRFGRVGARAAKGAIEGAVGAAAVEPIVLAGARAEQADYDAVDSLLNIGFGTALGGGLHVGAGFLVDRLAGRAPELAPHVQAVAEAPAAARETALRGAVAALAEDRPVRVGQVIRPEWPADFPRVVLQTRGDLITGSPDYAPARAGDLEAARRLVAGAIKDDKIAELAARLGDTSDVIVLPVRSASGNALPAAYAELLARRLGATLGEGVAKAAGESRRGTGGVERFGNRARFEGAVEAEKRYLLVDDYVTQGGTLAELRAFIESQGGRVVGATTLAASRASDRLAPAAEQVARMRQAMPETERLMRARLGYGFEALTDSELDALGRSSQEHLAALMADQTRLAPEDAAAVAAVDRRTQATLAAPADQQPALDEAAIGRQVERLSAELAAGRMDAAEAGYLAEADELVRNAELAARDYQAAAACLVRAG